MGLYFYKKKEIQTNKPSAKYTNYVQLTKKINHFDMAVNIRMKNLYLYQGVGLSLNFIPYDNDTLSFTYKNTNQWFTVFREDNRKNRIIQLNYNIFYRKYDLVNSKYRGWNYRYFYFGGAPSVFFFNINNYRKLMSGAAVMATEKKYKLKCVKFGIDLFAGLRLSFIHSRLTFGADLHFCDIFAPPTEEKYETLLYDEKKDASKAGYNFFDKFKLHQQLFKLNFMIEFNI